MKISFPLSLRPQASLRSCKNYARGTKSVIGLTRCTWTVKTCCRSSRVTLKNHHERDSCIGVTMEISSQFAWKTGNWFSKNRRPKASRCGNAISAICVFPIYITFEQIPSNAATKASSTKSGWQTVFRSSSGAGNRSRVAGKLQGISSTPETGKLQPRPRDGTDDRAQSRIKDVHDRLPKQSLNTLSLRGSVRRAAKTTLRNHGGTSVNSSSCSLVRRRALYRFRLRLPAWANRVAS